MQGQASAEPPTASNNIYRLATSAVSQRRSLRRRLTVCCASEATYRISLDTTYNCIRIPLQITSMNVASSRSRNPISPSYHTKCRCPAMRLRVRSLPLEVTHNKAGRCSAIEAIASINFISRVTVVRASNIRPMCWSTQMQPAQWPTHNRAWEFSLRVRSE